jgi:IS30 family transposase
MAQRTKRQRQSLNQDVAKQLKVELVCFNEEKEKTKYGLRDLVRDLQPQIATAIDNNWSWREIADVLLQKGVTISPDTLQQYYREVQKSGGSASKRKTSKTAKQVEQLESESIETEEDCEDNNLEIESSQELEPTTPEPLKPTRKLLTVNR